MKTNVRYFTLVALGSLMFLSATAQNSRQSAQRRRVQQMKDIVKELKLDDNQTALFTEVYTAYQDSLESLRPTASRERGKKQKELTEDEAAERLQTQLDREERRLALKRTLCEQLRDKGFTAVQILKIINPRPSAADRSSQRQMGNGGFPPPPGGGFPGGF